MRRTILWLGSFLLTLLLFAGCSPAANKPADTSREEARPSSAAPAVPRPVSYTVGACVRGAYRGDVDDFFGRLISGRNELEALKLDDTLPLDRYTDSYFSDKALILLGITLESGSMELRIDGAEAEGEGLTVRYTSISPGMLTCDMAYWQVLLEVDGEAVQGIRQIEGERNRVSLPSS